MYKMDTWPKTMNPFKRHVLNNTPCETTRCNRLTDSKAVDPSMVCEYRALLSRSSEEYSVRHHLAIVCMCVHQMCSKETGGGADKQNGSDQSAQLAQKSTALSWGQSWQCHRTPWIGSMPHISHWGRSTHTHTQPPTSWTLGWETHPNAS